MRFVWSKTKPILAVAIPIILLPLPLIAQDDVATFAYCLLIIASFWVLEIINIFVTALLPMVLLPICGIIEPSVLSKQYWPDTCMLFMGTLILACAIEKTGVHRRLALATLKYFGTSLRGLMFGLMLATWFLSMWISNTATCALMMPVLEAIFSIFEQSHPGENIPVNIVKGLTLAIPAAANPGGTATISGTPPNLVCSDILNETYECYEPRLTFANWIIIGLPTASVMLILNYLWMNSYWFGFSWITDIFCCGKKEDEKGRQSYSSFGTEDIQKVVVNQYNALPAMKWDEYFVVGNLICMVIMWFFKSPGFIQGWADFYPDKNKPSDSTVAIFFAVLLFIIPRKWPRNTSISELNWKEPIITWAEFQAYCPWGTIILIGSGIALSKASDVSGFSDWVAELLDGLGALPDDLILFIVVITVGFLTEITSNTACANIFIPILLALAEKIDQNPLFLAVGATFATSLAFMLPVATGANAICFSYGRIKMVDMMKCGIFLNVIDMLVVALMSIYFFPLILDSKNADQGWIHGICDNSTQVY